MPVYKLLNIYFILHIYKDYKFNCKIYVDMCL